MLIIYFIICLAVNGIFLFLFNDSVVITKNSLLPLMLLFLMIFMGAYQYYNRGKFDFNSNNYFYRAESKVVTVIVTKANVNVNVNNSILNYKDTFNGNIAKADIFTITPSVIIDNTLVDYIYFVIQL